VKNLDSRKLKWKTFLQRALLPGFLLCHVSFAGVDCSVFRFVAGHIKCLNIAVDVLQYVSECCSVLQFVAVWCSVMQCVAVRSSVCCRTHQLVESCCRIVLRMSQWLTACYIVLQCVTVYGSVLQDASTVENWAVRFLFVLELPLFFLRKTLPPHFIRSEFLCTDSLSCIPAHTLRSGGNIVWSRSFSNVSCYIQDCHLSVSLSLRRQDRIVLLCFSLSLSCSFLSGVKVVS